jgi:hypothetical protein
VLNLEGWDPSQSFTFTPNPDLPPPGDISPCLPVGDFCGDPSIRINTGGGSTPENGVFTFNFDDVDANGNIFFQNTGTLITSIEISTILTPDEMGSLVLFECSGGNIFQNCGFVDPPTPQGEELDLYFYNPYTPGGGIPSAVPEPSQWIFLLIAGTALVVVARRKASATSPTFVRTQQ